jgi:dihydroflavonol-4-reductase
MTDPAAKGERLPAISGERLWTVDVANALRRRMGAGASKVSTRALPNWLARLAALRDPKMKGIAPMLGMTMNCRCAIDPPL